MPNISHASMVRVNNALAKWARLNGKTVYTGAPLNVTDDFARADGVLGATTVGAEPWLGTGQMQILDGQMSSHAVTSSGLNYVDLDVSTGYRVEATLTGTGDGISTGTMSGGLAFRVDGSKFWYLAMRKSSSTHGMRLAKFNGSSYFTGTSSDIIVKPGDRVAVEVFDAERPEGDLTPVVVAYHQAAGTDVWTEVSRSEGDFYNYTKNGIGWYSTPGAVATKIDNLAITNPIGVDAPQDAPDAGHTGPLILAADDFDRADGPVGYTLDDRQWVGPSTAGIVGGVLDMTAQSGAKYVNLDTAINYRIESTVAAIDPSLGTRLGGLAFMTTDSATWYFGQRVNSTTPGMRFFKWNGSSYGSGTSSTVETQVGDRLAVEVLDVYLNGSLEPTRRLIGYHSPAGSDVWTEVCVSEGDNFNNGAIGVGYYGSGSNAFKFDNFVVTEIEGEVAPDADEVDPAGEVPTGLATTTTSASVYEAQVTWTEATTTAHYQVERDGIVGSKINVYGGVYKSPHLAGGNHTFKVRKWLRTRDELQADGVTVITKQVYGPWADAPTFIGRPWPTPVGNELQWGLPLDWGTRTDAPGVIVKNIAHGTTEIRMDSAGDYEWHLPTDAPLQMPDNIRFSIKMGSGASGPVRWTMIGGEIRSSLYSSSMVVKIVGANKFGMWWHIEGVKVGGGAAEDSWQMDLLEPQHGHQQRQQMMHERIYGAKIEHKSHADGEQNYRGPIVNLYDRVRHDSDYQGGFWFPAQHSTLLQKESGLFGDWSWRNFEVRMYVQPDTGKTGIPIYTYHNADTQFPKIHYEDGEHGIFVRHMEPLRPDGTPSQFPRDISHNAPLPIGNQQGEDSVWNRVQRSRVLEDGTTEGVIPPNGTVLLGGVHTPGLGYVSPGYAAIPPLP